MAALASIRSKSSRRTIQTEMDSQLAASLASLRVAVATLAVYLATVCRSVGFRHLQLIRSFPTASTMIKGHLTCSEILSYLATVLEIAPGPMDCSAVEAHQEDLVSLERNRASRHQRPQSLTDQALDWLTSTKGCLGIQVAVPPSNPTCHLSPRSANLHSPIHVQATLGKSAAGAGKAAIVEPVVQARTLLSAASWAIHRFHQSSVNT